MGTTYPGSIEDPDRFAELIERFESDEQRDYYYRRALETVDREFGDDWYRSDELALGGPMLLMYTWNFAATETKSMSVDVVKDILERHHGLIEQVRGTSLIDAGLKHGDPTVRTVKAVWSDMKDHFGQTGTSKVLSLLAPELFVMWDQDIRTRRQRRRDDPAGMKRSDRGVYFFLQEHGYSLDSNSTNFGRSATDYITFLEFCQDVLVDIGQHPILDERDATPAKLLDEALYAFYKLENG
jgi:hypothetical protein